MPKNIYIAGGGAVLALLILGGIIYFAEDRLPGEPADKAHFYKDESQSIARIRLKVFYAVPKNRAAQVMGNWRSVIEELLDKAKEFHVLQFRGKSILNYDVFPETIILEEDNSFYDTEVTNRGNPRALIAVAEELEKRVFRKEGDLYRPDFAQKVEDEYSVAGIVYEGVGAAGGIILPGEYESAAAAAEKFQISPDIIFKADVETVLGFFILSSRFFTEKEYEFFRTSLLYHEFAHTIGLPDLYDLNTNAVYSDDIMGAGRRGSIESAYIDRELLKELGVLR